MSAFGRVITALWPRTHAEIAVERWAAGVPEPLIGEDPFVLWRCNVHGGVGPCAKCLADEPVPPASVIDCGSCDGDFPDGSCPAALVAVGEDPAAGERSPEPRPAAGQPSDDRLVGLIADVLFDTRGMSANGQALAVAAFIEKAMQPAPSIETGHDMGLSAASEFFPQHTRGKE